MTLQDESIPVVLVTGAAGGFGRKMTRALLNNGHRVVLAGTNEATLRAIAPSEMRLRCRCVVSDFSVPGAVERLATDALAAFGRIDVLINNAGISTNVIDNAFAERPKRFWEIGDETMRRFYEINVSAPVQLAARLAPAMIERGWGRIINVTTSLRTMLRSPGYGGSKAALEAESACMAEDLTGTGVTVNALLPGGPTLTPMTENFPLPKSDMLDSEIMGAPTVYLASRQSDGVTGRRFIAALWDNALPVEEAAKAAGAPIAWSSLATEPFTRSSLVQRQHLRS